MWDSVIFQVGVPVNKIDVLFGSAEKFSKILHRTTYYLNCSTGCRLFFYRSLGAVHKVRHARGGRGSEKV